MFGRSGQMFPRQRTFHDAIYEEEYGSDNEDECCRCRGLSAILCWFLSVIILVGLAATVVLTVFFILRSRTMMKPNADVDVEIYGKEQGLHDQGNTSKELMGSTESFVPVETGKLNAGNKSGAGPNATKNDMVAIVSEEHNAIVNSIQVDQAEDASVSHPRNHHSNNRHNRLQPYPTITSSTTEIPDASDEETTSEEIENDQNSEAGSSLFNLFSGPTNPSYNTPLNQNVDEFVDKESTIRHIHHGSLSKESSETSYHDASPVQQVLFTESPKVTLTTPNPYNNRRNLQTTRFHTGRTSFSTTTMIPPEESNEENENNVTQNENEENVLNDRNIDKVDNEEEEEDEDGQIEDFRPNGERSRETIEINEESHRSIKDDQENSSEETEVEENKINVAKSSSVSVQTTTSVYNRMSEEENEMGSESGESQLKQMLLDEIPPHDKDDGKNFSSEDTNDDLNSRQEFNLAHVVKSTTIPRPITTAATKATKTLKTRQNTLTRIISRNFTRQGTNSTTISDGGSTVSATTEPSITTSSPLVTMEGHKYNYSITPLERTKLRLKSVESSEQEVMTAKPLTKLRYRSTTPKGAAMVTPEPPSTAAPRTRGTTTATTPDKYGMTPGAESSSVESPIDIVPSPDLSPQKGHQSNLPEDADLTLASSEESMTPEKFLDVLVGDEDHKTLITKKTHNGIVTSAILPPWYDTNGAINISISEVLATNSTTVSNAVAKVENEIISEGIFNFGEIHNQLKPSEKQQTLPNKDTSKPTEGTGSEFERLVNIISKQHSSSEEVPQTRFAYKKVKQVVLKKPAVGLMAQGSRYMPQIPGRANLFSASSKDAELANEESNNPTTVFANDQLTFNEPSEYVSRTGELLSTSGVEPDDYYPGDKGNSDITATHMSDESEVFSSDEMVDSTVESVSPSHVIDVNFVEADNPQEIIIEQDSIAPMEEFVGKDYTYKEHPPTISTAGSSSNEHVVAAPEDFIRGSGIRKPVSSEEETENDLEGSGSAPVEISLSSTISTTTSTSSPILSSSLPSVVIRRPAYTREEIAKSVVKLSTKSVALVSDGDVSMKSEAADGVHVTGFHEFEDYEDEIYEQGSYENQGHGSGSIEQWSTEKVDSGQKWSAPDKVFDAVPDNPQQLSSEDYVMRKSADPVVITKQVNVRNKTNTIDSTAPAEGEYHSKDGWRPVISGAAHNPSPSDSTSDLHYNEDASEEADSVQEDSFDSNLGEGELRQESPYQELPSLQPNLQQRTSESNVLLEVHGKGKLKPSPMIPPPIPANVKFPDSEEDHEDRHHHGRHNPRQHIPMTKFDQTKYAVRPVPPQIVMRRHPHSKMPYLPPLALNNRQSPTIRPQAFLQAIPSNPKFSEQPPPSNNNRNFHIRPNMPIRRFNFGTPQAQPRSGGNIKWPSEKDNDNNKTERKNDTPVTHSEVSTTSRKRKRRAIV